MTNKLPTVFSHHGEVVTVNGDLFTVKVCYSGSAHLVDAKCASTLCEGDQVSVSFSGSLIPEERAWIASPAQSPQGII